MIQLKLLFLIIFLCISCGDKTTSSENLATAGPGGTTYQGGETQWLRGLVSGNYMRDTLYFLEYDNFNNGGILTDRGFSSMSNDLISDAIFHGVPWPSDEALYIKYNREIPRFKVFNAQNNIIDTNPSLLFSYFFGTLYDNDIRARSIFDYRIKEYFSYVDRISLEEYNTRPLLFTTCRLEEPIEQNNLNVTEIYFYYTASGQVKVRIYEFNQKRFDYSSVFNYQKSGLIDADISRFGEATIENDELKINALIHISRRGEGTQLVYSAQIDHYYSRNRNYEGGEMGCIHAKTIDDFLDIITVRRAVTNTENVNGPQQAELPSSLENN